MGSVSKPISTQNKLGIRKDAEFVCSIINKSNSNMHIQCAVCLHRFTDNSCTEELTESQVTIAALGHDMGAWVSVTEPTCFAVGKSESTCSRDGCTYKETRIDAINPEAHKWGEWTQTKEPTCTESGEETRVCIDNASHVETRAIPKLDSAKPDTSDKEVNPDAPAKKANPLKVAAKKTIKAKATKTTKIKKAITVKATQGKVTAKTNNKKVKVVVKKNMKNGKTYKLNIIVKKGLKKNKTYKVKVRIKAAGNAEYGPRL